MYILKGDAVIQVTVEVIRRSNSRSTQYNWNDIQEVLLNHFSAFEIPFPLIARASKDLPAREDVLAFRQQVETDLKRVHRNVSYRFTFTEV